MRLKHFRVEIGSLIMPDQASGWLMPGDPTQRAIDNLSNGTVSIGQKSALVEESLGSPIGVTYTL